MKKNIYLAVNKEGVPFMFVDEPKRTQNSWSGSFFVHSLLYKQVCDLIANSQLTWDNDPELIQVEI